MTVKKAVIPVAGFGTRFLPATLAVPKNVLPVFDTPSIHYCVEEAARAGIEEVVFVTSRGQDAIPRYFAGAPELERALEARGDFSTLSLVRGVREMAKITLATQTEQRGLGHAVLTARDAVGDEPFAVFLPDDVIWADAPTIGGMIETHERSGGCVVAVKEVPDEAVPNLGIVDVGGDTGREARILRMVEKPRLEDAPSNLAIVGRYVLTPDVFDALAGAAPGALGEIQLTDGIAALLDDPGALAYRFEGEHYDVGTPLGMLKASVAAALRREGLVDDLRAWLARVSG